jgi:hypothetical protein
VPRRPRRLHTLRREPRVLQIVATVEVDERRILERYPQIATEPPVDERGSGDRLVPHRAERRDAASGDGRRPGRDGAHHGARLEQPGGEVLVIAVQVEDDRMPLPQPRERREEPRGQRVGVDGQRHAGADRVGGVGAEFGQGVVFEQRRLTREADDRRARLGGAHRLRAHEHQPTELLLERLDPLAHGGGRDVQPPGSSIQRALVHDDGHGLREFEGNSHQ